MNNGSVNFLILLLLLFSSSCHSQNAKTNKVKQMANFLQDAVIQTHKNGDSAKLFLAYEMIKNEKVYDQCELNQYYLQSGIAVLTLLKKYEELDCLLKNKKNNIEHNLREDLIDANEYLRYKASDYPMAINAMRRTVFRLENQLKINPDDSIAEQKLMLTKVYIIGKKKVLEEIDRIEKNASPKHSADYYQTLKYTISKLQMDEKMLKVDEVNANEEKNKKYYPKPEVGK